MIVQTKQRFVIYLDEEEAEEFINDATALQARVRSELQRQRNGHAVRNAAAKNVTQPNFSPRAASKMNGKRKHTRRAFSRVTCPDCSKALPAHWLARHRAKHHPSADDAHAAADLSVA